MAIKKSELYSTLWVSYDSIPKRMNTSQNEDDILVNV